MSKVYLAGPMSGYPEWNFPAFHAAAAELRDLGLNVVNPAELDDPGHVPGSEDWSWYLRRDLKKLLDCDSIVLLPGWDESRGAKLEYRVAYELGMSFEDYEPLVHYLKLMREKAKAT
ncbi:MULTISPECIES: DUF4406 domain-containing protein [Nocardia]|uniref:DUF4406 domain-containing protein n=1 Tax=Nocardia TaxID=1817 RepID=UPI0007A5587D|nr:MULTISPECIES: DUF4406 domain-containing protein [Nocardia]